MKSKNSHYWYVHIITQGENVADNGGVREGYRAYKNFLKRAMQEKAEPKLPGLQKYSNDQLFFISFAQVSFWSQIILNGN